MSRDRQMAILNLQNQLRSLQNNPIGYFKYEIKDDDIFQWIIYMKGTGDTSYEGGTFKLQLTFTEKFPYEPPELRVLNDFWHPNVYMDGKVCISILHPPGDDPMSGELPEERWLPVHTAETIMLSFMSMLADPNCSSPANVDSSVMFRRDRAAFNRRVKSLVEKANKELPEGFIMPKAKRKIKSPMMGDCMFDEEEGELEIMIESEDDFSDDDLDEEGDFSDDDDLEQFDDDDDDLDDDDVDAMSDEV